MLYNIIRGHMHCAHRFDGTPIQGFHVTYWFAANVYLEGRTMEGEGLVYVLDDLAEKILADDLYEIRTIRFLHYLYKENRFYSERITNLVEKEIIREL